MSIPGRLRALGVLIVCLLLPGLSFAQAEASASLPVEAPLGASLWENVLFYIFGAVTLLMAVLVIVRRNPLHGALALVVAFFSLAMIYVMLYAHLLAALQILVYAGAIMVLFVFVIMLLNLTQRELGAPQGLLKKSLLMVPLVFFVASILVAVKGGLDLILLPSGEIGEATFLHHAPVGGSVTSGEALPTEYGNTAGIGEQLFTRYLLPFELASVLLLVAIVGAVAVAKKRI